MRKLFTALFLFFTIYIYTTPANAQGVGAGGVNPIVFGMTDTCSYLNYLDAESTIEPDYWYYGKKPPIFTNPFSAFPATSSNGLYVDGNYWSSILADTLDKRYNVTYSFHTDSIDIPYCSADEVLISFYIAIDSLSTLDSDNDTLYTESTLVQNYQLVQGDTLIICTISTTWSEIASLDSIVLGLSWGSGLSFNLDGASGLLSYDTCYTVSNVGMKVFVENCDPINTSDEQLNLNIETLLDTLTALIQPCPPILRNRMLFCEGSNDTLLFTGNRYHSVTIYPDTLNSVFYVGNNTTLMIPSNREIRYQAPECRLLLEQFYLFCNETNTIIVTIE